MPILIGRNAQKPKIQAAAVSEVLGNVTAIKESQCILPLDHAFGHEIEAPRVSSPHVKAVTAWRFVPALQKRTFAASSSEAAISLLPWPLVETGTEGERCDSKP